MTKKDLIIGILRTNPRGFGFVECKEKGQEDVFIPKSGMLDAIDGDTVEVEINSIISPKGPDGVITKVIKREKTHLVGIIQAKIHKKFVAYVPILGFDWPVSVLSQKELNIGDRVLLKVLSWEDKNDETICEIEKNLGNISDPSEDINVAIEEFRLRNLFSEKVLKEAKAFGDEPRASDLKDRDNLTDITTFTIDPETAKDFDDALSIKKDATGYHLGVHIADVAHYIKPNTLLDEEAALRCNSVYFPGRSIPMLPNELSSNLCSLKPHVIRLTVSVLMDFDENGDLIGHRIVRSYIKSKKRFTYEEAFKLLNSKEQSPIKDDLTLLVELCNLLKQKRLNRGSIDFALDESVVIIDKKGDPQKIIIVPYDITHQLVEEFMLKANETVAYNLIKKNKILIFRIHEEPSEENFKDFFDLARSMGFKVPKDPNRHDIQDLFVQAKGSQYIQILSISFIKCMRLAYYSPDNLGHYGLALEHYCHFTSPIRRYSDLITQRLLFNEEDKKLDLNEIAALCSNKERVAMRAENSVILLKKMRLLKKYHDKDPHQHYPAVVTKIMPFGFFFELSELSIEGYIHVSELHNDYYVYEQQFHHLHGTNTNKIYAFGTKIEVTLSNIDFIFLETSWKIILPINSSKKNRRKKKRR